MNIPEKVLRAFIKETEGTNFFKISLCIVKRGKHEHYEIDKHITLTKDGDVITTDQDNKQLNS